jgi:pimeloyl-ACP methyl ester carboxylesterase
MEPDRRADRLTRHFFRDVDRVRTQLGSRFTAIEDYVIERARRPGSSAANRAFPQPLTEDELRSVSVPVVVICGRHDRIVPLAHTQHVSARLGWPHVVVDEAGHLPYLEQPRTFAAALRSAIDPPTQPQHKQEDQ